MKHLSQKQTLFLLASGIVLVTATLAASRLARRRTLVSQVDPTAANRKNLTPHVNSPLVHRNLTAPDSNIVINRHVIAGGGGSSSGGNMRIEGTIGEAGASRLMSAGSMTLAGGFWSIEGNAGNALPSITVTVSPATVGANGPDLVYTFTRFGSSAGTLTINFSVGGTATLGTHYTETGAATFNSSSGTINIAPATSTTNMIVHPNPTSTSDLDRTIIITLTGASGYNVDNPNVAVGTIVYDNTAVVSPPVILTEANTNNAAALDSVTFVRTPLTVGDNHNFSSDHTTRVILFTSYLALTQPSSNLSVRAGGVDLPVENVGPILIDAVHASYIIVRLPQNLPPGDLLLTVSVGGATSSATILSIAP